MKKQQEDAAHGGYSDRKLWVFYLLYTAFSLAAISGTHGQEWLFVINVVSLFGIIRYNRWERENYSISRDWIVTKEKTIINAERTRVTPKRVLIPKLNFRKFKKSSKKSAAHLLPAHN